MKNSEKFSLRKTNSFAENVRSRLWVWGLFSLETFLLLFVSTWLFCKVPLGKERLPHLLQRLSLRQKKQPKGPTFWFHGASVGESLALEWLIAHVLREYANVHVLLTTTSRASGDIWVRKIKETPLYNGRLHHRMLPLDHLFLMSRFVNKWNPRALFLGEGDLWPMMQYVLHTRSTPRFLLAGRLTQKEWLKWRPFKSLFTWMTRGMHVQVPTDLQKRLFSSLGAEDVVCMPALKWLQRPAEEEKSAVVKDFTAKSIAICAASTHAGEEAVLVGAFKALQKKHPRLKLILAPRDLSRIKQVVKLLKNAHLAFRLWSESEKSKSNPASVVIVDKMGIMSGVYQNSHIVFVGGSLFEDMEGHNLIEVGWKKCVVLHGGFMAKHREVAQIFVEQKASQVVDIENMAAALDDLLCCPEKMAAISEKAYELVKEKAQSTAVTYTAFLKKVYKELQLSHGE